MPELIREIREEVGYVEAYSADDEDRESLAAYRDALEERLIAATQTTTDSPEGLREKLLAVRERCELVRTNSGPVADGSKFASFGDASKYRAQGEVHIADEVLRLLDSLTSPEPEGEELTQVELEALLYVRMGGSAEELQELVEARRSGEAKLRRLLDAAKPMKLKISGGGDPAGMNNAIYAAMEQHAPTQSTEGVTEEELLSEENIERAAAKSYEDFRDLNLMPEDPRWPEVEEDVRQELREGMRENIRYVVEALREEAR